MLVFQVPVLGRVGLGRLVMHRVPTEGGGIVKDTFGNGECDGVAEGAGTSDGSATVVRVDDGAAGVILERD